MLETAAVEKKIPPPLPPKTRRGCPKNSDGSGGATILQSNGHVVKIRIDRPIVADGGERDDEPSPRDQHLIGRRSSTVKINITCVDPFVYRYNGVDDDDVDDDDEDDHDVVAAHGRRRSLSGHSSPLDSGTGSDLDTGSRRDESDDGTCSCDSLTSGSSTAETPVVVKTAPVASTAVDTAAAVVAAAVAAVVAADTAAVVPNVVSDVTKTDVVATTAVATVVEEPPKHPSPPTIRVQQGCYGDTANATAITANRVIDLNNTDQYYSFHMNENVFDDVDAGTATKTQTADGDDTFAGCKTVVANGRASDTIRSAKGTIRGVKNRVRAGIATFLQPKTSKTWQEKEAGKVVLYTTTMGIVRDTYQRCLQVRQILRTHLVKYVERDVFMSREVQKEIRERLDTDTISVPQLFVEGNLIGDAEAVERLNESGELRSILKPFKSPDACTTCQVCGGYRLLPCPMCNGSKKSVHRNHFTTEMIALKCMNCDEVGLVQCYAC